MRTLVVGHRGIGKTSLLKRLKLYLTDSFYRLFDLDEEVEVRQGIKIPELFSKYGEAHFRRIEISTLEAIAQENESFTGRVYVTAGAGYEGTVPKGWSCLWIRRTTDGQGRIFEDRPRLDQSALPLDEFLDRLPLRETRYSSMCDQQFFLSEGFDFANGVEKQILRSEVQHCVGVVTLSTGDVTSIPRLLKMGVDFIELRDDLLDGSALQRALDLIPRERVLLSFRSPASIPLSLKLVEDYGLNCVDWALELGAPVRDLKPQILSVHTLKGQETDLAAALDSLVREYPEVPILKVALMTQNFDELKVGHCWSQKSPLRRVFLPISESGRWNWYRLLMKTSAPLNFLREGGGSAPDQPTLFDWMRVGAGTQPFAAVMGHPVKHSRTPGQHFEFFRSQGLNTYAIDILPEEFTERTLTFLKSLGLKFAAVTAPLKNLVVAHCSKLSPDAEDLGSVNTLAFVGDQCVGHNTDLAGFRESVLKSGVHASEPAGLWGGLGTLPVMKKVLPRAVAFSARSGKPRDPSEIAFEPPKVIVWAIGRAQMGDSKYPVANWKPELVLDLNYADDSPGREYAMRVGAKYVSGLEMFQKQAEEQQEFWRPYVCK